MVSIQVLIIIDILSMTKVMDNRKLWLISFFRIALKFLCQFNDPKFSENHTHDIIDHCIVV